MPTTITITITKILTTYIRILGGMRESTETVNQWEMNMIAKAVQDSAD
jgi:hypothetical protein